MPLLDGQISGCAIRLGHCLQTLEDTRIDNRLILGIVRNLLSLTKEVVRQVGHHNREDVSQGQGDDHHSHEWETPFEDGPELNILGRNPLEVVGGHRHGRR